MKGEHFALCGHTKGIWAVYGLKKGLANGPVKG